MNNTITDPWVKKFERLHKILSTMKVPRERISEPFDYAWLMRNLHIDNRDHPDLFEARALIKQLYIEENGV